MDTRQQKNAVVSSDEWYTPKWIIDELGPFDLDPCAPMEPPYPIAPLSYNKEQDGLAHDWPSTAVVWMNPPYSRAPLRQFVEKMAKHGRGIALLVNLSRCYLSNRCQYALHASSSEILASRRRNRASVLWLMSGGMGKRM